MGCISNCLRCNPFLPFYFSKYPTQLNFSWNYWTPPSTIVNYQYNFTLNGTNKGGAYSFGQSISFTYECYHKVILETGDSILSLDFVYKIMHLKSQLLQFPEKLFAVPFIHIAHFVNFEMIQFINCFAYTYFIFVLFSPQVNFFCSIFLHAKARESRQNRFRDKTA